MGLITKGGTLLKGSGGLASSQNCCCLKVSCYCFTRTENYQVVERWMVCYRDPYWNADTGTWVYPDGMPCDGGSNGQICPPGSTGRYVTMTGNAVETCGCGTGGTAYSASLLKTQSEIDACTPLSPPP